MIWCGHIASVVAEVDLKCEAEVLWINDSTKAAIRFELKSV